MPDVFAVPYLLPGSYSGELTPEAAEARLRAASEILPFSAVMLGGDLPTSIEQACAEEADRIGAALFLNHPLLGPGQCPNRPGALSEIMQSLAPVVQGGIYDGVFFDRVGFDSPATNPPELLACFCEHCVRAARESDVDLEAFQNLSLTPERWLAAMFTLTGEEAIDAVFRFRTHSILKLLEPAAGAVRAAELEVGLNCLTPTLTRMTGQDLTYFDYHCDWINIHTKPLSNEFGALARWLVSQGIPEEDALDMLAHVAGTPLPATIEQLTTEGVAPDVLWLETQRTRESGVTNMVLAVDLGEDRTAENIRQTFGALRSGVPNGYSLAPDLWQIPLERLSLIHSSQGRIRPL